MAKSNISIDESISKSVENDIKMIKKMADIGVDPNKAIDFISNLRVLKQEENSLEKQLDMEYKLASIGVLLE